MERRKFVIFSFLALCLALAPTALASTTSFVDGNGINGSDVNDCQTAQTACKTMGRAISPALPSGSIIVAVATYTKNLTIGFSLNVIDSGASTTIIDGGGAGSVVSAIPPFAKLADFTMPCPPPPPREQDSISPCGISRLYRNK
jgi:hypothetical protein